MTKEPYQFKDELGNREKNISVVEECLKKAIGKSEYTLAAIFKLIDHYLPQEKAKWAELQTEKLRHEILVSFTKKNSHSSFSDFNFRKY